MRFLIMAITTIGTLNCAADADDEQEIAPAPALQQQIEKTARAIVKVNDDAGAEVAVRELETLKKIAKGDYVTLVRQLAYYRQQNPNNMKKAMGSAGVFKYLRVPRKTVRDAVVPYLGTKNPEMKKILEDFLSEVDRPDGAPPDFSLYEPVIRKNKASPPKNVIGYMYRTSPGRALLTMKRIYIPESGQGDALVSFEGVIKDLMEKENRSLLSEELTPEVREALDELARKDKWWIRLFVAENLRRHEELRTRELVDRLLKDADPFVREAVSFARKGKKSEKRDK